ncbi:hypothetical protein TrLO_g15877 [Triparma laevis f. longispina]|nr:hypothetical protein TrLO_g15877 [Triparma laevis f. longispina]
MNDAELLTTRTVSLAVAILSLRDTLTTSTASGDGFAKWFTTNYWLVDILCVFLIIFLVRLNIRLFYGLNQHMRSSASIVLASMRDSETLMAIVDETSRSRAHTRASEGSYNVIDQMLSTESYRKIVTLQKELRVHTMPAGERRRWTDDGGTALDNSS